jgi:two-component system, OmpR family, sensor histidine kinase PhoQ
MPSLKRRLTVAATVTLVVALGSTAAVLDSAFRNTSRTFIQERLQAQAYAILAVTEENADGELRVVETPPDPRMATPGSGLYARFFSDLQGALWSSPSLLGEQVEFRQDGTPGVPSFSEYQLDSGRLLFTLSFPIVWETSNGQQRRYVVQLAEASDVYTAQLNAFRQRLFVWFALAALATIAAQAWVLNWGLKPLSRAAEEVEQIRNGLRTRIEEEYYAELTPLTRSVNQLIDGADQRLRRYRDALGNLAHTLKTPLAVLRAETGASEAPASAIVDEQVSRMDRAISYHLKRAAAGGKSILGPPVPLPGAVASLANVLTRAYAERRIEIETSISSEAQFHGDEGDLTEVLGNLMDNACKWADAQITVSALHTSEALVIRVSDDGPGISRNQQQRLLERGARADPDVPGHGIGLAVVQQLVCEVYDGEINFSRDAGRFTVELTLPGHVPQA